MSGKDAYLSNDANDSQYAGNLGITDAVDTDPVSVLPFGEAVKNTYTGVTEFELTDLFSAGADFAGNAVSFAADPLNWLISAGLTFLIDFVQPLEDLLGLVTGNAERIESYAAAWQELGAALEPLGSSVQQAATDALLEWEGKDAEAAKNRLIEFGWGIRATAHETATIAGLLALFSKIMTAAQQIIIGIIATLVEWMIIQWAAALTAAGPTMGASVAAAGTATAVQATSATTRAVRIVDQVVMLLKRIQALLFKVLPLKLQENVASSVMQFSAAGATASTAIRVTGSVLGDEGNYIGPAGNVATGILKNNAPEGAGDPDKPWEIDRALDTDR